MAQARVALLMAHGAARTGDPRLERAALDALASFVVLVDRGGVRTLVATAAGQEPAPWYVERAYPGESPWKGAALNGFMVTLLNLLGAAAALDRGGAGVPRGRGGHRPGARPRRPRGGDARAPPRRPRLGLLELLRPAHARPPLAQLPRRPQLPLLPRAPARPAGRGLPRPRLRRDRGAVAGLRRPRRRRLPDALTAGARPAGPSAGRWGATRRPRAAWGSPSRLRVSQIAWRVMPWARRSRMRSATAAGVEDGRPGRPVSARPAVRDRPGLPRGRLGEHLPHRAPAVGGDVERPAAATRSCSRPRPPRAPARPGRLSE